MTKTTYTNITHCRICSSKKLDQLVEFSPQYIASTLVKNNLNHPLAKVKIPMTILLCRTCSLVQLKETTNPDLLFQNYFYRSAVNQTMRNNLKDIVRDIKKHCGFKKGDTVVDIGCNDAVMLSYFPSSLKRIGVEPAKNINWSTLPKSITIINDYFRKKDYLKLTSNGKANVVTAIAMFYDLANPNFVTADIKSILAPGGTVCIQVSYLLNTVQQANFYDFCHEHLEYYSLKSLQYLLQRNGLTIVDASTNFANGGSIRIFAKHSEENPHIAQSVVQLLKQENQAKLSHLTTYHRFKKRMQILARWVRTYIETEIKKGNSVYGLGASTKGNVVIQICGLTKLHMPKISDRNKSKIGYKTLGIDMEVISETQAHKDNPALMLVSPWYFREEILKREAPYIKNGGKLLFIMPYPCIVDKDGETRFSINL